MNRIIVLSALFGILMTGAAAAQTAEVSVMPVNGTCPSGFDLQKAAPDSGDTCVQAAGALAGPGTITLSSFSDDGDDEDDEDDEDDGDHDSADHDSDSD